MASTMRKRRAKKTSGTTKRRKGGSAMRKAGTSGLAARVATLEKGHKKLEANDRIIVGVLEVHQRALVTGGLLEARAKKVPALGGGRRKK